ncbi:glycosyl transferase group 1 [Denitrovibrio acetiphilus DSM 12809]|uniref:tRNA-queuosine alpha-mannosyltransferase n=1 Tax=Denitrovibrio acetiphilus (strain DSM 12809 / NBRC 114555 / N2460) TaxID=522772 RepID=D4H1N6_DENA2|nr:DUF3524 domain-containing protein [Denitrovibrio acetiphilus]ADD68796.1 glycosyl transferase group 1 [Denitrovibrio acetiphilus DSM 12809]
MKILILSAYNAVSHQHLNKGLIQNFSEVDFSLLTLPPRYFAWRSRGNSLSFAYENRDVLTAGYDLIFATSMTDMTALRGLVPEIANTPLIVYFHENQFDYPENRSSHNNIEAKLVSIYNALAADHVVFNTDYNRQTFLHGARKLLRKMPDHVPSGLTEIIKNKSRVLSVPINPLRKYQYRHDKPSILWNHRWEYDKAPERFYMALCKLREMTGDFRLNLAGQFFRDVPESFIAIKEEFKEHTDHCGYLETREEYENVMSESSVVVSTSLHDFQGLSVMEAADAGCTPVLPDRVSYPELFPAGCLYAASEDTDKEAENCAEKLYEALHKAQKCDMSPYYWGNMRDRYRQLFESAV